jgi:hypothetical protein
MPKKSTKTILAALKAEGVEIEDLDKVTSRLDDLELDPAEFVGTDNIILSREEHRELKDDLTKLRQRAKKAEGERDDLREAMDAGDSDNARMAKEYKKKLDDQAPVLDKLLERQRETWTAQAETIPEHLKAEFRFAEEGKDLEVDDLLHNTAKLDEYKRIGALEGEAPTPGEGEGEGEPTPPGAPRVPPARQKPAKYTAEQLAAMTPDQQIEAGYAQNAAKK